MSTPQPAPALRLTALESEERPAWLSRMEAAFAAGLRDAGIQPGQEPIPKAKEMDEVLRATGNEALQVIHDGETVGGAVITAKHQGRRRLELFFIDAGHHGGGIGATAWNTIEARYADTEVWETETPYFDQRNIHFYINRCGFHIAEFFHPGHRPEQGSSGDHPGPVRSFRFEKRMPLVVAQ